MSGSVLFDAPGPRARARNRVISAVTLGLIGLAVWAVILGLVGLVTAGLILRGEARR